MSVLADKTIGGTRARPPLPFGQSQEAVAQIPQALEMISKQISSLQRLLRQHAESSKTTSDETDSHANGWAERLHDRVDALLVEQRVTNYLLAELVATQKLIIRDDVTDDARQLRGEAYRRVLNGE